MDMISARFDPSTPILLTGEYLPTTEMKEIAEKPDVIPCTGTSPIISYILNPSLNKSKQEAPSTLSLPALW